MQPGWAQARGALLGWLCLELLAPPAVQANLSRNAAGPQAMGDAGAFTLDAAVQHERDSDARTWTLETGLQYELSGRLQLLAEAICFERQSPAAGDPVSGMGDTDLTLSWLARAERELLPPLVLALRVKLPTARQEELGTGRADFAALLVLAKEFGEFELALEAEYETLGSPAGEALADQFIYTLAVDYGVNDYLSVYGELFGNSAPSAQESRSDAALAGVELEWPLSEAAAPYFSFEVDTEGVASARAGIEWSW